MSIGFKRDLDGTPAQFWTAAGGVASVAPADQQAELSDPYWCCTVGGRTIRLREVRPGDFDSEDARADLEEAARRELRRGTP